MTDALTEETMSPQLAGLVLRLQEWSRNCLIDGLKMDNGEPTLQALLREAYLTLMRSDDSSAVETAATPRYLRPWVGTASMFASEHKLAVTDQWCQGWNDCLDALDAKGCETERYPEKAPAPRECDYDFSTPGDREMYDKALADWRALKATPRLEPIHAVTGDPTSPTIGHREIK